jgi:hypothetical protein
MFTMEALQQDYASCRERGILKRTGYSVAQGATRRGALARLALAASLQLHFILGWRWRAVFDVRQ